MTIVHDFGCLDRVTYTVAHLMDLPNAVTPPFSNPATEERTMSECYLPTHEWGRRDGDHVVIGLSAFAAGEVGEVIHVELPKVGATVSRGKACAEIESVKSVNDYYAPVDGTIAAVNTALATSPELLNQDPLGKGWFAKVKPSAANPLTGLLTTDAYQKQLKK